MRRAIQRLIQDPLALKLINGDFAEGDTVLVDAAAERRRTDVRPSWCRVAVSGLDRTVEARKCGQTL